MRIPDFLKPGRGIPRIMSGSLIMLVLVAAVWIAYLSGAINFEDDTVLNVTAVPLPQAGGTIPIDVAVQLVNNTDNTLQLTAPTPCKVFKWVLVDSRRDFVQAKPDEVCPQVLMQATLEGNHNVTENFVLNIETRRLRPDTSYELRVSYWGIMGQSKVDFELERAR